MSKKISTILSSNVNATSVANIAGGVAGSIPYQSAPGVTGFIPAGTTGQVLQSNGAAAPSWVANGSIIRCLIVAGGGSSGRTSSGLGGGGGAGNANAGTASLAGGSGIVILSIPTTSYTGIQTGSPVVTTSGTNTILTFNTSRSYTA